MGRRFESCRAHQLLQQLCPVAHPAFGAVERYNTLLYSASLLHRNLQLETLSYDAENGLLAHGILLVGAAGNSGVDGVGDDNDNGPNYPSNYDFRQHHRGSGDGPDRQPRLLLQLWPAILTTESIPTTLAPA